MARQRLTNETIDRVESLLERSERVLAEQERATAQATAAKTAIEEAAKVSERVEEKVGLLNEKVSQLEFKVDQSHGDREQLRNEIRALTQVLQVGDSSIAVKVAKHTQMHAEHQKQFDTLSGRIFSAMLLGVSHLIAFLLALISGLILWLANRSGGSGK